MNWLTRFEWEMKIHPGDVIMEGWSRRTGRRSDWRDQTENLWLCFIQKTNEKPSAGESEPGWPSRTVTSTRFWHWKEDLVGSDCDHAVSTSEPVLQTSYSSTLFQPLSEWLHWVFQRDVGSRRNTMSVPEPEHPHCKTLVVCRVSLRWQPLF